VGEWRGEGVTIYPDDRLIPIPQRCEYKNGEHQPTQQLTFSVDGRRDAYPTTRNISSTARIEGSILYFEGRLPTHQVLLLPDGASSTSQQVRVRQAFFLKSVGC